MSKPELHECVCPADFAAHFLAINKERSAEGWGQDERTQFCLLQRLFQAAMSHERSEVSKLVGYSYEFSKYQFLKSHYRVMGLEPPNSAGTDSRG